MRSAAAAVSMALLALLAAELARPDPAQQVLAPVTAFGRGVPELVPPPNLPSRTSVSVTAILARPLFTPGRRPGNGPPVVAPPEPGPAPRLTGTIITASGRTALFVVPEQARPLAAREGDQVGSFVVGAIGLDQVAVVGPDGAALWRVEFGNQATPAAPAAPAPAVTEQARHTRGNEDQHAE